MWKERRGERERDMKPHKWMQLVAQEKMQEQVRQGGESDHRIKVKWNLKRKKKKKRQNWINTYTLPKGKKVMEHKGDSDTNQNFSPVGWGCRIHRLHPCRGIRTPHPDECPGYDTKQSDSEAAVMLELWRIRSTPSLPLLPYPIWPEVAEPDRMKT